MSAKDALELVRSQLESALLRLSRLEQRVAQLERQPLTRRIFDRLVHAPDTRCQEEPPMGDERQPEYPPSSVMAAIFAFHTLLGMLGQIAALAAATIITAPAWRAFVGGIGAILNVGAIALGVRYQSPRERAILEEHDPTPAMPKAPPASPVVAFLPFLLVPLCFVIGCTAAQIAQWKTFGLGALDCAASSARAGFLDAAGDALAELLARAGGDNAGGSFDPAALGQALAQKYGKEAALCAVGKAAAILLNGNMKGAPTPAARTVGWLVQHQAEWAK